jgi:glycosyltransferase involved in cell wall biosynthesis
LHAVGPRYLGYGYAPELLPWLHASVRNYDAVIVHGLWQYHGLATRRALWGGKVPYFVYPHGMLDPWFKRRYRLKHLKKRLYWLGAEHRVLRDAAGVFFTTAEESRLAAGTFEPFDVRALDMGYGLALDPVAEGARAEDFLRHFPTLRGRRLLLFLARVHPKKGLDLLIEAFAQVAAEHPDLHLVVAGPDESGLRPQLDHQAARLQVADRITWTGMLKGSAKWGALKAAEVFALPSHQENFGIAVAEALAVGLPVLVSDKVNIWREVQGAGAGLVGSDDLAGTRATLQAWLAQAPGRRAAMRAAAVACYQQHFHVDAAARKLVDTVRGHKVENSG